MHTTNFLKFWDRMYEARLAQSVEHETLNLRVVGSSPTLGDQLFCLSFLRNIFCIFLLMRKWWRIVSKQFFENKLRDKQGPPRVTKPLILTLTLEKFALREEREQKSRGINLNTLWGLDQHLINTGQSTLKDYGLIITFFSDFPVKLWLYKVSPISYQT